MASAVAAADLAIKTRINTQWGTTTPIAWPNVSFNPPDAAQWLQVTVLWGDGFLETMEATASNRLFGVVQLDLMGPQGAGLGAMMVIVDTLRDILNRWDGSRLSFGATSPPQQLEDERYARLMVSTPFDLRET